MMEKKTLESVLMDLFREMQLEPKVAIYQLPGKEGIALQIVKDGYTQETFVFDVVGTTATLLE